MKKRGVPARALRLEEQDRDTYLVQLTPAERVAMVWPITQDAWSVKGDFVAESRLQRHVVRVLRERR